ncbi:MAG: DUF4785 domain-containing protein [Gammaproteobacteria bacterium]
MKIRLLSAFTAAIIVCAPSFAQSRAVELTPATDGDLRAANLVAAPDMPLANTSREAVSFTWPAVDAPASERSEVHRAQSRSYGVTVSASDLAKGVALQLDAPGAVVRVSGQRRGQLIDPDQLTIALASGREMTARAATDQLVLRDNMEAAGLNVAGQGLGIRFAAELGAGQVTLRYPQSRRDDSVRIDVFERNSDKVLSVQSAADHFMQAREASVQIAWGEASRGASVDGYALAPDGQRHELIFATNGTARLASPARVASQPGLWEWHVQATDTDGVRRDAKTVFALTAAVARLNNRASVVQQPDAVIIELGAEVRSAGRYEARATLLGTNADGKLVPALTSATADWLEPGSGALRLSFDTAAIKALGLSAPFSLSNLSLLDQSRMGTLERRQSAVTF